ncbi:hypothetical protein THAOC_20327, partial [Thalassiosira oceanica]
NRLGLSHTGSSPVGVALPFAQAILTLRRDNPLGQRQCVTTETMHTSFYSLARNRLGLSHTGSSPVGVALPFAQAILTLRRDNPFGQQIDWVYPTQAQVLSASRFLLPKPFRSNFGDNRVGLLVKLRIGLPWRFNAYTTSMAVTVFLCKDRGFELANPLC